MQAKDIMTTSVISVPQDRKIEDAVRLMLDHHVSALPVVDAEGALKGLVSEGDLMRRVRDTDGPRRSWWLELLGGSGNSAQEFIKLNSHHIADVMTRDVVSVEEDTPIAEIARLLEKHRIKRVPVLREERVVGIVSRANLLHALSAIPDGALGEPSEDDRVLRSKIDEVLKEVPGATVNLINYTVDKGNVAIWGVADSDFEENAIRVAVENVSGVHSVDIHMGRLAAWAYGI
ncbi:CBS domain-containing protein [Sulfitobacter mediterraneus]|jgi:CBS-domain-containing membrane protein|uniref:CBS domain-containing protein n=1 Tax=Roseobacteraceae TaxID=2854170 RepID=UPI000DBE2419|nr:MULTISPECIES: CBS domain-containing protein [Roseobacteraceae]MBM1634877.1 CBS domain-containing protein [Sulfitobacter mediterraneus]MBM1642711.1 CBS domain-containing protein [Sulfitobacter mediterraneus]MBM1646677.1 CBS domain-containing protein [Sulfitobacter mediterraneus]MBM1650802.1 CBS domain-containing protein [Sulfitobacter mediterraneus]MBM1654732.1 CBS domain-containing protein [Sulfitobacter mediterraneus]